MHPVIRVPFLGNRGFLTVLIWEELGGIGKDWEDLREKEPVFKAGNRGKSKKVSRCYLVYCLLLLPPTITVQ